VSSFVDLLLEVEVMVVDDNDDDDDDDDGYVGAGRP